MASLKMLTSLSRGVLYTRTTGRMMGRLHPPLPTISIANTSTVEGVSASVVVTLSSALTEAMTFAYATADGTATSADYTATSGSTSIAAGSTTATLTIPTATRTGTQGSRTVTVTITNPLTASARALTITQSSATVTITDATDSTVSVAAVASITEGSPLVFRVTVTPQLTTATTFTYATSDITAVSGTDYTTASGTGTVLANTPSVDISVTTALRADYQGTRTVRMTISNAVSASVSRSISTPTATGYIVDSSAPPTGTHAYYTKQADHPTTVAAYTLRSTDSITSGTLKLDPGYWEYRYGAGDEYHTPRDGAQCNMGHSLAATQQYRVNLRPYACSTGKLFTVVDKWLGPEFRTAINEAADGFLQHKFHQFRSRNASGQVDAIYCEPRIEYHTSRGTYPLIGTHNLRTYSGGGFEGAVSDTPYTPTGSGAATSETVSVRGNEWVRFFYEWHFDQPGTAFTEWNTAYNGGSAIGTKTITSSSYGARNQIQTLRLLKMTGATHSMTLTFGGQTTTPIAYSDFVAEDGSANIKSALEALSNIDAGAITVRKWPSQRNYDIQMGGNLAGLTNALITVTPTGFSGPGVYQKMAPGNYTELTVPSYDKWHDYDTWTPGPHVTIAGHSDTAINGTHNAIDFGLTTLFISAAATGGTGGTVSKHFHMFSWWQATESSNAQRVIYRVPLVRSWDDITRFDFEINTSNGIDTLFGAFINAAPTVGSPTTITTATPHNFVTGEYVVITGNAAIAKRYYVVTVLSPTSFQIPATVTAATTAALSGFYAGSHGYASKVLTLYARNLVFQRNRDIVDTDTALFARPTA